MTRSLFWLTFTVKEGEIALVRRGGLIHAAHGAGEHRMFDPLRKLSVETFNVARSNLTVDHVIPRSKGGSSSWENIVASCAPCDESRCVK